MTAKASIAERHFAGFVNRIADGDLKIPPYPATAARLADLIASERYTLNRLAKVIEVDQVLSAAVIRQANSAGHSGQPATTVHAAVSRLGSKEIVRLAFALGVGAEVTKPGPFLDLRRLYWRHAVLGAEFSRDAAPMFGVHPNEAYLCGLLHDFGKVIGLSCLEEVLLSSSVVPQNSPAQCFQAIEVKHQELGMIVAVEWKLDKQVMQAITQHHNATGDSDAMVKLMAVCDKVIESLDSQPCFTRELLNDVPFLDEATKDELYPKMTELPGRVAALDLNPQDPKKRRRTPASRGKRGNGPRLGKRASTLTGESYAVNYDLVVADMEGDIHYKVVEFCAVGLAVTGPATLAEQSIFKFRLETGDDLYDFLGTVTLSIPSEHRIEIQPIGLLGLTAEKWLRTVTRSKQAGALVRAQGRGRVTQSLQAVQLLQPAPSAQKADCQLSSRSKALLGSFELSENWS